ncbi:MAG: exonuclease protein-like protein [Ramlibacter sp.]|nr:exonuclease protein-like protein [Ramlibacter sp.]
MTTVAVIDFETTGLSPSMGDRATEIAVVLMEGDQVVDRFQSLMNAGVRISAFIEAYTGISNAMIAAAPPAQTVMADASRFVAGRPMAAHNASFDRRFWRAELERADRPAEEPFACTMLLSRRLYPQAPNYRLGSLAAFHALPSSGRAHRALADAEVAAALLGQIRNDLRSRFGVPEPRHELLMKLQACTRKAVPRAIEQAKLSDSGASTKR